MRSATRRMWSLCEPIHAITYFAPEARAAADALGMRGFWMGYVAQRAAPLGAVGPAVVTAAFFGFHPTRIARALPDAWRIAGPETALASRLAGVDAALRRLWGDAGVSSPEVTEAADLAWAAAATADCAGRVLAAANQALPRPDAAHLALWQAATTLREHRGDGHNAVLLARGVTPAQAHLIKAAAGEADGEVLREGRRIDDAAWHEGIATLRVDGVLDADLRLTTTGQHRHAEIEEATDAAARSPWERLGPEATARLATLLAPLTATVLDSGMLPFPNPVGLVPMFAPQAPLRA